MTDRRAFSVAIFARHQGRVLLIKHKRLGTWLPVGGEMDDGETPLQAAQRELREETGLTGEFRLASGVDGTPRGYIGYEEHSAGSKGLHMNFAFVADVDTDTIEPCDEFTDFAWVTDLAGRECPRNVKELVEIALHGHPLIALARRWLHTFNTRDLDGLLALYDENAVHISPKLRVRMPESNGEIRGRPALRAWWDDSMKRLPGLRYDELHLTAYADRVFMEYNRVNPGEPDLVVAEVLVVGNSGRIERSHVFHG